MEQGPPPSTPNPLPGLVPEPFPAPKRSEDGAADTGRSVPGFAPCPIQLGSLLVTANEVQQGGRRDVFPLWVPTHHRVSASRTRRGWGGRRGDGEDAGEMGRVQGEMRRMQGRWGGRRGAVPSSPPPIEHNFTPHKFNFQGASARSIQRRLPPAINPPAHPKRR